MTITSTKTGILQRKCACGGTPGPTGECAECRRKHLGLQGKLTINQPGDRYEQEADRVAGQVLRMPEPGLQRQVDPEEGDEEETLQTKPAFGQITPLVQRQALDPDEEEEEAMQAKSASGQTGQAAVTPSAVVPAGGGRPLNSATRAFMEPRFGHDFSQVRIHDGPQAAKSARAVNALAYTTGRDIVFGAGQYAPEGSQGKLLLAHELTHVIQQRGGKRLQRKYRPNGQHIAGNINISPVSPGVQRLTNPLSDMSTFQSPGSTGWRGAIWGCYRSNCTRKHKGWDIHAAQGTECKAAVAGTTTHHSEGTAGYGDYVVLTSTATPTKKYYYAHLKTRETAGTVAEGAKIGTTGVTGNASASRPHLHFTVKESGSKVDPDGKGFTKPTKVIEASGSTATTINTSDPEPCTPCSM